MFYPLVSALLFFKSALAISYSSPKLRARGAFGYAAGTTGGGTITPAVPSSTDELASWLGDDTPRVILLDKTYDFTHSEGKQTTKACKPWTCSGNPQVAVDYNGWCEHYEPNAAMMTVTVDKAGTTAIEVGSNKTLLGKGNVGAIKGKGLRIANGGNVIIQNIHISDINAPFVWGGDAITIESAKNVWIDHNYFKDIGRQFIVTVHSVQSVTISDNVFDGSSAYSASCNERHYWTLLFSGAPDSITFARNHLYKTSGRGPRIDGSEGIQLVHIYNNYFDDIAGHALDASGKAEALVEGNYFERVTEPAKLHTKGSIFAPIDHATAAECMPYIGRNCVINRLVNSGILEHKETMGISGFKQVPTITKATIMEASQVKEYVVKNAGTGVIKNE